MLGNPKITEANRTETKEITFRLRTQRTSDAAYLAPSGMAGFPNVKKEDITAGLPDVEKDNILPAGESQTTPCFSKGQATETQVDTWTKTKDACLAMLKPKNVFPVIALRCKSLAAKAMERNVQRVIGEVTMFNIITNVVVSTLDPQIGVMLPNCIPLHLLIVMSMLHGLSKDTRIFQDIYICWEEIKSVAMEGHGNSIVIANQILLGPLTKHAMSAFQKYTAMLLCNRRAGLCPLKQDLMKFWMADLKNWVIEKKNIMVLQNEVERLLKKSCKL